MGEVRTGQHHLGCTVGGLRLLLRAVLNIGIVGKYDRTAAHGLGPRPAGLPAQVAATAVVGLGLQQLVWRVLLLVEAPQGRFESCLNAVGLQTDKGWIGVALRSRVLKMDALGGRSVVRAGGSWGAA